MEYNKELQRNNLRYLKVLRNRPTRSEKDIQRLLNELGVKYIFQKGFVKPFHRIVDFYLPRPHRIIIEVDGKIHDSLVWKDNSKDSKFKIYRGMKTLRIKNEDTNTMTALELKKLIDSLYFSDLIV